MRRIKKIKSRRFKIPEISLTPLIDSALTLLIIFIVTTPMVQNGIKINLPQGNSKEVGSQQELVVSINKKNELFFNSYPVSQKNLIQTIQKSLQGREETPVYVKADKTVFYGDVIKIVDELKQAKVKYVAMAIRPVA
jgi:biopolymer transport protein TolR